MPLINKLIFTALLFLFCAASIVHAQNTDPFGNGAQLNTTLQDTSTSPGDTIIGNAFMTLFKGKPGRAALYSLLIPGGGQLYNKKYWKFPFAVAIDASVTTWLIYNRKNYKFYQGELEKGLAQPIKPLNIAQIRENRDFFRKRQEYAWLILVAGHLIPVMDAYVDRHLKDFDISSDLSFEFGSQTSPGGAIAGIKVCIPLNSPIKQKAILQF
jgi:hypothetical protein